ncbi:MAG: D-sedoheptulose-7-phosphate isomerase [Devosia sp.]
MTDIAKLASVEAELREIGKNFEAFAGQAVSVSRAAHLIVDALATGGKAMFCGNGGSAADSQHLAAELMGRYLMDRKPLPALALTVDTSALTAIGNDYGFEAVFARQLQGIGRPGDVLIAISTSGSSANVVAAMHKAREMGIHTISMTGADASPMSKLADVAVRVPATRTNRIQEMHIAAGHIICGLVEAALC